MGRGEDSPLPELSELMVVVSPLAPVVCVEDEAKGGGVGWRPSADKMADTVFAAPSAAASVEN